MTKAARNDATEEREYRRAFEGLVWALADLTEAQPDFDSTWSERPIPQRGGLIYATLRLDEATAAVRKATHATEDAARAVSLAAEAIGLVTQEE